MSSHDRHKYDNPVLPESVYGHVLGLLGRHLREDAAGAVHLDLACGFGHIAEHVSRDHGLTYVGVDLDDTGLADLRGRGFETHVADIGGHDVADALRAALGERRLASITLLDGLEHLTDGAPLLRAVHGLVEEHGAILVVSVPNVTHIDLGIKTLLGEWGYTPAGLLDETHHTLYGARSLERAFAEAGLIRVGADDYLLAESDQHVPTDHVGLSRVSSFGQWVRAVRDGAEPHALVNQFVWALSAAPEPLPAPASPADRRTDLFLSVIMRTQGRRLQELREALLCLAGQTDRDFELLLVAHRTTADELAAVEQIVAEQPRSFRERIRLLPLDHGSRSAPLNLGLSAAQGRYIAVFDDDDIVMGTWVEEFARAERDHAGRILRVASLRQDVEIAEVRGLPVIRAVDSPTATYATTFYLAQHLLHNQSPQGSWAFPRSLHADFGITFDDSMTTTEDWEFLLRTAEIAGVTDIEKVTFIYRWWVSRESSRTHHSRDEWLANEAEIQRRVDSRPILLPAGESQRLREDMRRLRKLERENIRLRRRSVRLQGELDAALDRAFLGPIRRRLRIRTRAKGLLGR